MAEESRQTYHEEGGVDGRLKSFKNITMAVYALQAASFLIGVTFIAAVIVNYIKKDDVRGTWLESHFRWQIRTFWFSLLWAFLGAMTFPIGLGAIILTADALWFLYRVVKGWLNLADGKKMYAEKP